MEQEIIKINGLKFEVAELSVSKDASPQILDALLKIQIEISKLNELAKNQK